VSSFWKRRDEGLEGELRRMRAEPRDEFVASVADRVRGPRKLAGRLRLGTAIALTIGLLAALAPVGGASYAGGAAANVVSAVSHALSPVSHASKRVHKSPARDQYRKPKKKKKKKKKKKGGSAGVRARRGPHFTG
jgi:hypothetical protein